MYTCNEYGGHCCDQFEGHCLRGECGGTATFVDPLGPFGILGTCTSQENYSMIGFSLIKG